ncbi:nuclear transcription factor Y subunit B-5-like [Impatiens glandulifera]|uniref:nuclear transcription factor Y subunit B-5-like n=1 Tax=Impatiens glandulifera TaxID=253017 RepID=UPI001FB14018|nr:nuclear transcription factor Y subunit B-5-like [Impatiens glandulifera]
MADNIGDRSSNNDGYIKEQDRLLPIANVGRIMKQILPANAKISKESKETMQECVSEFISFVTSEASDKCKKERRKTVNGDDVCWALGVLGFDDYSGPLKMYLDRYRALEGDRSSNQEKINSTSEDKDEPSNSSYGEASSFAKRSKTVQNSNTHSTSRPF